MRAYPSKMLGAVVFAAAFLCLLGITLGVPAIPPGEIIYPFLGIPEMTYSIFGISGVVLVNGIINGVVWGVIVWMIYALGRRASKREVIPPMSVPVYTHIPAPTSLRRGVKRSRKVRKRESFVPLDQDIETIEGIGPTYGNRLRNSGVEIVENLLRVGSTRNGRRALAIKVGVAPATMHKWVYRADFFRIRGIGKQYSSLLESAGVNTVTDLSRRNPKNLYDRLRETNREKNLVRRTPPYKMIKGWTKSAKNLKRIVKY